MKRCKVSVGMAVYNGERFLAGAIESVLQQTMNDFEIVISDNASTDGTEDICRSYAAGDPRIRYVRQARNLGSGRNHNVVCQLSTGEYFKWLSHDDRCAPTYLERCIEVLDRDPGIMICYSNTQIIDENDNPLENPYRRILRDDGDSPSCRFREAAWYEHLCFAVYGVIRGDVLRRMPMGCYTGGDNVLLARLALLGRFERLPEFLLYNRAHDNRSTVVLPSRMQEKRLHITNHIGWRPAYEWWDTSYEGKINFPYWNLFREYVRSIWLAPIPWSEKAKCYLYMLPWLGKYHARMRIDVIIAADVLLAPLLRAISPGRNAPGGRPSQSGVEPSSGVASRNP